MTTTVYFKRLMNYKEKRLTIHVLQQLAGIDKHILGNFCGKNNKNFHIKNISSLDGSAMLQ